MFQRLKSSLMTRLCKSARFFLSIDTIQLNKWNGSNIDKWLVKCEILLLEYIYIYIFKNTSLLFKRLLYMIVYLSILDIFTTWITYNLFIYCSIFSKNIKDDVYSELKKNTDYNEKPVIVCCRLLIVVIYFTFEKEGQWLTF